MPVPLTLQRYLKVVDVVLEVVDARLPASSRHPELGKLLRDKNLILVLNKADLAHPLATRQWLNYFNLQGTPAVAVNSKTGEGLNRLKQMLKELATRKKEKLSRRGIQRPVLRVMIAGIPNVGKSSLLNRLVGKAVTRTGDRPGITRGPQWVRRPDGWEILDTPGIVTFPQGDSREALLLGALGCVPEVRAQPEKIAGELVRVLQRQDRWKSEAPTQEILEEIGRQRGFLLTGGEVDRERAAWSLINEFRRGELGRITLEWPEEERKECIDEGEGGG